MTRILDASNRLTRSDVELVSRVALFSGLARTIIADLLDHASVRSYDQQQLLFSAGDPADRTFVVLKGAVKLFVVDADGHETIIEIIGAGNSFAEAAIFGSKRFPVNAEAMPGARVVTIEAATFLRKLDGNRQLALEMLASLGRWQMRLMAELRQLKGQTPAQRLACYLLTLVDPAADAAARVRLPHRKHVIAARIGVTPESLSRAFARLAKIGVVAKGDEVIIDDAPRLKRFCQHG